MHQNHATSSANKWPAPSPRIQELMRQGAEKALNAPPEWLLEIDQASLAPDNMKRMSEDPVLVAAAKRVNRTSLVHWAAANIENPGAPVPRYISADMLSNARELVRRGATDLMFSASRSAQNAAWQLWMNIVFELTTDPKELHELLEVSARSIATFIDVNMEGITEIMMAEHEERMRGTHADRRELVTLIVEGSPIGAQQASQRLGYTLEQPHHAAVIWSEEADTTLHGLEQAAQALARFAGTRQSLVVMVNASTLWVWVHGGKPIDLKALQYAVKGLPGVRMAIGATGAGIEGFRRGHLDALATQRLLGRLHASACVVHVDRVRLVSLMTQNKETAQHFIAHTLGDLAAADPTLRQALYTFLESGCNATQAAERLHTHRNTLLRRLERAEALLPRPLQNQRVHVAAALEALSWTADDQQ